MKEITVHEFKEAIEACHDDCLFIDVRTPEEYQEKHIEGVINYPLDKLSDYSEVFQKYNNIYAQCRLGGRSAKACELIKEFNVPNLYNVVGGIEAWKEAGFETIQSI